MFKVQHFKRVNMDSNIFKTLSKKFKKDIDAKLTEDQQKVEEEMTELMEKHLYWAIVYWRSVDHVNLLNSYKMVVPTSLGVEFTNCRQGLKRVNTREFRTKMAEEIEQLGKAELKMLSEKLGGQKLFFGDEVSNLDLVVFSYVAQIAMLGKDQVCALREFLKTDCNNLLELIETVREKVWGEDWEKANDDKMHINLYNDYETDTNNPSVPGKAVIKNETLLVNADLDECLLSITKEEVNISTEHSENIPAIKTENLLNKKPEERSWCCQMCTKKFKYKKSLKKHINNHIQESEEENIPAIKTEKLLNEDLEKRSGSWRCQMCDKKFKYKKSLKKHINDHMQEGFVYSCQQCDYKGKSKRYLKAHVKTIHEGIDYICDRCAHKATTKQGLKKHIDSIHKDIKFPCTQCDFKSSNMYNLKHHVRSVHEGTYYLCDQCDYKSMHNRSLQAHIKSVHLGIRYPCKQCDFKSNNSANLAKHVKVIHKGVIYPCTQCDYKAKYAAHLKRHIESIHFNVRYHCDQCDFKATQKDYLSRHIRSVHGGS